MEVNYSESNSGNLFLPYSGQSMINNAKETILKVMTVGKAEEVEKCLNY